MGKNSAIQDTRLNLALEQLKSVLVDGEMVEAFAVQRRLFALTHRRILIVATSGRFIALRRRLFAGFDMGDFRWQDLRDAKLKVGIFGADVNFGASGTSDLAIGSPGALGNPGQYSHNYLGLRKDQAQQVYRFAQAQDQAWREKRRVRELEELRARSGGVQFAASPVAPSATSANSQNSDAASRLQQAKQMLDDKLITDSEYQSIKAKIISGI